MDTAPQPLQPEQKQETSRAVVPIILFCVLLVGAWLTTRDIWAALRISLILTFTIQVLVWLVPWVARHALPITFGIMLTAGALWAKEHPRELCSGIPQVCGLEWQETKADIRADVCRKVPRLCDAGEPQAGRAKQVWVERAIAPEDTPVHHQFEQAPAIEAVNAQALARPSSSGQSFSRGMGSGSNLEGLRAGLNNDIYQRPSSAPETYEGAYGRQDADLAPPRVAAGAGSLCSPDDSDFQGYRSGNVAHCKRDVSKGMKRRIKADAGISPDQYGDYEIDHIIPLGLGGDNSPQNLQPLPHALAREKSRLEQELFNKVSSGEMSQAEAVEHIRAWRSSNQAP